MKNAMGGSLGGLGGALGGHRGVRFAGSPLGPLFGAKGSLQGPPGSSRGGSFFACFCCIFANSIVKYCYFHFWAVSGPRVGRVRAGTFSVIFARLLFAKP